MRGGLCGTFKGEPTTRPLSCESTGSRWVELSLDPPAGTADAERCTPAGCLSILGERGGLRLGEASLLTGIRCCELKLDGESSKTEFSALVEACAQFADKSEFALRAAAPAFKLVTEQ